MKSALEGLKGVTKVEMDLKQDLFRVTATGSETPTKEGLFKAIQELGYTPSLVAGAKFAAVTKADPTRGGMPALIQNALDQARKESKQFVLVKGTGDN